MTERKGEAPVKQKLKKWRQNMKRIMTMAAIGIIAIGFGTATLNAAETGTGTKIMKDGLKNGLKEGLKNGTKNGMKEGLKNGTKNGMKNGLKEGLKNGMKNGMKNGKKNGDKK